jgi:hypothetical protein
VPDNCDRFTIDGCDLFGFVPVVPMTLPEITALVAGLPGELIGMWRTDSVCVAPIPGMGFGSEPTSFAYHQADLIGERRRVAAEQGRTVITGWSIAQSYWDAWSDAWRQAQQSGVAFRAFAVWLPKAGPGELVANEFTAVVPLAWRRTDSTDGRGELLLGGGPWPEGVLPEIDPIECEES